jgi:hypothetical protein
LAVLLDTPVVGVGLSLAEAISPLLIVVEEEAVRVWVLEAGTGIFEGFENASVVKGWSKIFFNDAPFPPPTLLELSRFGARTGDVTPLDVLFSLSFAARSDVLFCCAMPAPVVRLVRLEPEAEG